jgi:transcriptional regulator with XRE-family HTH domain
VRLACRLRALRAERSLRTLAEQVGVNRGQLSEIERGVRLPPDELLERLEATIGAPAHEWYAPPVLLAL